MCTMSMVMDHYWDEWSPRRTSTRPWIFEETPPAVVIPAGVEPVTQKEVEEFRRLLDRAREYDKRNNEPDCELQEKKDRILKLAEELGVKIDFL